MSKLSDIKDANGVSLQSYVETLIEKCDQQEGVTAIILIAHSQDKLDLKTNVPLAVIPDVLSQMAAQMRKPPKSHEPHVIKKES